MLATYMPGQIRAIQTAYLIGAIQVLLGARIRLAFMYFETNIKNVYQNRVAI